jgi:2-succinyl-5-enolpyruvyl-6-hydroxy-3-cyclohexene-1-carboxylate synthase
VNVVANRGVSGIDGLLASAVGYAAGRAAPVTLLLGDLSLLHDLNSLALLAAARVPVVAVVINNDGGGIFSLLPVAAATPAFEKVFGLPHGRDFEGAASMFGVPFVRVASTEAFVRAYQAACRKNRSALIEVTTTRASTKSAWQSLQRAVARAVAGK